MLITCAFSLKGQELAQDSNLLGEWKSAFSADGRQNWKPEFTLRCLNSFFFKGSLASGGVRVDDKRTLGLMVGHGMTHVDAAPGDLHQIQSALFMRRYFHLGKNDVVAIYSDLEVGGLWTYKVDGKYATDNKTGEVIEKINTDPGDVMFIVAWEPGLRIRFYKNLHLFVGPSVSNEYIGVHCGLGF